jgi:hypothetical protein
LTTIKTSQLRPRPAYNAEILGLKICASRVFLVEKEISDELAMANHRNRGDRARVRLMGPGVGSDSGHNSQSGGGQRG